MTQPGPKPKPKAVRVFEGNPGNIPLNENEPAPQGCQDLIPADWIMPDCPYMSATDFNLNEVSLGIWNQVAEPLNRIGVLTEVDKDKLLRYCYTFALWLKCKAWIDKYGTEHPVYSEYWGQEKDKDGNYKTTWKRSLKKMQEYPAVSRLLSLSTELNRYEAEFGIGAASRTRIQVVVKSALEDNKDGQGAMDNDFNYAAKDGLRVVK